MLSQKMILSFFMGKFWRNDIQQDFRYSDSTKDTKKVDIKGRTEMNYADVIEFVKTQTAENGRPPNYEFRSRFEYNLTFGQYNHSKVH